jgi:hypothetical protein
VSASVSQNLPFCDKQNDKTFSGESVESVPVGAPLPKISTPDTNPTITSFFIIFSPFWVKSSETTPPNAGVDRAVQEHQANIPMDGKDRYT